MSSRDIKKSARNSLKHHIFISILVCFIVTFIISNGYKFNTTVQFSSNNGINNSITNVILDTNNLNTIENFVKNTKLHKSIINITNYKPTRGVLSVFFNQITGTGSLIFGILNANNYFFFNNSISSIVIYIIGALIYLLVWIFVQNVILVGKSRYFLEHRKYQTTSIYKILFVYKYGKVSKVAKIMLLKDIKMLLWWMTIVMAPIKHYQYSMIPYLLAENPEIDLKDCFELSKKMTDGYKFEMLKIDLSLIHWYILGLISYGITNLFYFNPYKESIHAEIYMELREKIYNKNKKHFKDKNLSGENQFGEYPVNEYFIEPKHHKKIINTSYEYKYTLVDLVLFFFIFSFFGYIWEVIYTFFNSGILTNRGTMYGPWVPIYGWGGIIILILAMELKDKPFKLFMGAFIVSGVMEYLTSLYLDLVYGKKWWDYKGYFLNINGRICLEGLLVFAFAGCIFTYFIIPYLTNVTRKINPKFKKVVITILVIIYIIDFIYSTINPNAGGLAK